ncbi:xylose isomerase [Pantoea sp. Eser]|nr:xylose isomerase [Pantoea sp. Eser]
MSAIDISSFSEWAIDSDRSLRYEGTKSTQPLAFRHYNPDEVILGKTMAEHLRFAACYWHTFCWNGADMFGIGAFDRPWQKNGDALQLAKQKADVAFEFFHKLNVPYYCFRDADVSPEGDSLRSYQDNFAIMTDKLLEKQQETGVKLLWGTANCFTHPRYDAGAATNPDPAVFAWAATQVCSAMQATKTLGGENYVLWGGREGYETLLNTDLRQEREQIGRFMQMVVEHKHKISFQGTLLIEPKQQEPTKHQYDYDVATVYGFLKQFGLEKEIKVNVDANRGDAQCGWDTDQFPVSVEENALVMYEILKAGGFTTGGLNFDAKVHRQSTDKYDLFYGHIGSTDTMALALKVAARMIGDGELDKRVAQRYSGWNGEFGQQILKGEFSLASLAAHAQQQQLNPQHQSGRQEQLENLVNHYLFDF